MKNARGETRVALDAHAEVETELGALKEKHAVGAFSGRIGLSPAVIGWAASCDDGP